MIDVGTGVLVRAGVAFAAAGHGMTVFQLGLVLTVLAASTAAAAAPSVFVQIMRTASGGRGR